MLSSALIFTIVGVGEPGYSGDGGPARRAGLNQPFDVALDRHGNLYFADTNNHCVRRVERATGRVATVAGTGQPGYAGDGGPATAALLNSPYGVALDDDGNLYIVDRLNACVRLVEAATGVIRTIAGTGEKGYGGDGGPARQATFNGPKEIAVDRHGDILVVDTENHRIRRVGAASGLVATVAGTGQAGGAGDGGPATSATLNRPHGVCVDDDGNLYIGDSENHRIRFVALDGEASLPW